MTSSYPDYKFKINADLITSGHEFPKQKENSATPVILKTLVLSDRKFRKLNDNGEYCSSEVAFFIPCIILDLLENVPLKGFHIGWKQQQQLKKNTMFL